MANNILLTGIPRSGTTLACFLLSQTDDFVALNEPMRTAIYKTRRASLDGIPVFLADTRKSILERGKAIARAVGGKMTDNHFAGSTTDGTREKLVRKQEIDIDKDLSPDFSLAIKHNALFTLLLRELLPSYPVYAFVRNPLSVLGSWNSLDLPASQGRIRAATWLDPALATALDEITDLYERQLYILDWYFRQYLEILAPEQVIKYEDVVANAQQALARITPGAHMLASNLQSKNKSNAYDNELMNKLGSMLLEREEHACWAFYHKDEVSNLLT